MAENFDIAKFLKENALGSYGILGKYVDLQPLKEMNEDMDDVDAVLKKWKDDPSTDPEGDWRNKPYDQAQASAQDWFDEYEEEGRLDDFYGMSVEELIDALKLFGEDNAQEVAPILHKMINQEDGNMNETEDLGGWDGNKKYNQYNGRYDDESGPAIANENVEMEERFDRMIGLIDQSVVSKLPLLKKAVDAARAKGLSDSAIFNMLSSNSLVGKSINDLVDDGFDSQDIVDFFGTDFSANEEVPVSSSSVEMEEAQDYEYTPAEKFDMEPQEGPNDPLGPDAPKYPRADFADAVYAANQAGLSKDELIRLINQNAK